MVNITGTLIWYYYICKREVWLMSHHIEPQQNDDLITIGRIISEQSYSREKKEIRIDNIAIDLLTKNSESIIVSEVKKSSHFLESAKMQLAFYLWQLKQKGISRLSGELRFPKEKKKVKVELTLTLEDKLNEICKEIEKIVNFEKPPKPVKIKYCKACSYYELCWV